mmetsp:Transcript_21330/g.52206  ORF Transcript_21330/g.52206 Transcript_21330/m.52206 type:complete len:87 (-) Transcript_21330:540-800(-)
MNGVEFLVKLAKCEQKIGNHLIHSNLNWQCCLSESASPPVSWNVPESVCQLDFEVYWGGLCQANLSLFSSTKKSRRVYFYLPRRKL